MQYAFILGHNPKLSVAEILAVLPQAKVIEETSSFLIIDNEEFDCLEMIDRLGGTIKIGKIVGTQISKKVTVEKLKEIKSESKLNFAVSYYDSKPNNLGMMIKKELKDAGISCRLVVSRDKALSSVVVQKNKCHEFLVLGKKWLGETCAIQDFENYGQRDYGRPVRDMKSGSLPPKLAQIMINLAQLPKGETILDPFCGSGTVLQEALLLGYKAVGSDISDKAIKDSEQNLQWFKNLYQPPVANYKLIKSDIRGLSRQVSSVDAIVTEPYLGPALKGHESLQELKKIIIGLAKLYDDAFSEFRRILDPGAKVVIIFPAFRYGKEILELPVSGEIKKLGFTQINKDKLVYSRDNQKVWRQIYIFQR